MFIEDNIKFEYALGETKGYIPSRGTKYSVGYDLRLPKGVTIPPESSTIVDLGIRVKFPKDLWLAIYPRSGNVFRGLKVVVENSVIDYDYYDTGKPIHVIITNYTNTTFLLSKGTSIAQGVFHKAIISNDVVDTKRKGGFGSTFN